MSAVPARPDFHALGFDPAPGALGAVGELAERYGSAGEDLGEALTSLEQIVHQQGIWAGEASEAFARRVGELPEYLGAAARSMSRAGAALRTWHTDLGELQRRAADLEARAGQAAAVADRAMRNPDFALAQQTFTDPRSLRLAQQLLDHAARQLQDAIDACTVVQAEAVTLLEQHGELAGRAAAALRAAREAAPEEPGLLEHAFDALGELAENVVNGIADTYDELENFVQDNANALAKVSDVVGDIGNALGVLSDFVPEPAGAALGAVATGFGLAALGGHGTAKLAGADVAGETLWFDALGAGTSLAGSIPGVPSTLVKGAAYGLLGSQFTGEGLSAATGKPWESPVDDLVNYWVPRDGTQAVVSLLSPAATAFWNAAEQGHALDEAPGRMRERRHDRVWE